MSVCRRCQRQNVECDRSAQSIRFSQKAKRGQSVFDPDQTWLQTTSTLRYVDESVGDTTAENTNDSSAVDEGMSDHIPDQAETHTSQPISMTEQHDDNAETSQHITDHYTNEFEATIPQTTGHPDFSSFPSATFFSPQSHLFNDTHHTDLQSPLSQLSLAKSYSADTEVNQARTKAVLLQYFVQELSPWFDLCDPERHFAQVVPQRARSSPILLNAICAASARKWVSKRINTTGQEKHQHNEIFLPHLQAGAHLEYQNECIRDLLALSLDLEQVQNVDLLAASIILRTDEETGAPFHQSQGDKQLFLRVTGVFIDAQTPGVAAMPHTSPMLNLAHDSPVTGGALQTLRSPILATGDDSAIAAIHMVSNDFDSSLTEPFLDEPQVEGLRQACFWIALRQELYAAFMNQRKIEFPLSRFDSFRSYSAASDAVWADRVVILHADVLDRCHEDTEGGSLLATRQERWEELKHQVSCLEAALPLSFRPIHSQPPVRNHPRALPRPFPELWYLSYCHVTAAAYMELTKILLASFAPIGMRLGAGGRAHQREAVRQIREATIKLCGMALCNRYAPPIYAYACAAVALCGDYFDDETLVAEQDALLWFLVESENHLACSTKVVADKLRAAWLEP